MTKWGMGLWFALISVIYGVGCVILTLSYPIFQIVFLPRTITLVWGVLLLFAEICIYIISVKTVMSAFRKKQLVVDGIYKFSQHPAYASWIVFLVPGISFLINSWIGITYSIAMYFVTIALVKSEEEYLEKVFGKGYLEYRNSQSIRSWDFGVKKKGF